MGPLEEIEALGFGALWLGGSPSLVEARAYLEATTTLTVATEAIGRVGGGEGQHQGASQTHQDEGADGEFELEFHS